MVPALFDPAEIAGQRLRDVRIYYSRRTGCVSACKFGSDSDLMQLGADVALFSSEESASCIVPLAAPALCLPVSPLTR